jgi:GT2 family glycosyltransferase
MLCLDSVTKAIEHLDAEIIVVDNKSEDESCKFVKAFFPDVILISNTENLGFSKGNNIGVEQAKGEYLCILNPDTVIPEDCFTKLISFHKELQNPGAIGVQLVDGSGDFLKESKRNVPTPKVALMKLLGDCSQYYNLKLNQNKRGETDILVGAFMFMKTPLYRQVNGFDEDYFMYGEDIDLSYRIQKAGFKNYYFGEIQAVHFKGESTTKDQVYLERFYNAMYIFYKKHFRNYKTSYELVKQILKLAKIIEEIKLKSLKPMDASKRYTLIITEDSCLTKQIKSKIATEVNSAVKIPEEFTNTLIVFDAESISYKESIEALIKAKHKNNIFRYRPRKQNFIIGSESKHFKGVILKLNE